MPGRPSSRTHKYTMGSRPTDAEVRRHFRQRDRVWGEEFDKNTERTLMDFEDARAWHTGSSLTEDGSWSTPSYTGSQYLPGQGVSKFSLSTRHLVYVVLGAVVGGLTNALLVGGTMTDLQSSYSRAAATVRYAPPILGAVIGGLMGLFSQYEKETSGAAVFEHLSGHIVLGALGGVAQAILLYAIVMIVDKGLLEAIVSIIFFVPVIALVFSMFGVLITSVLAGVVWGVLYRAAGRLFHLDQTG